MLQVSLPKSVDVDGILDRDGLVQYWGNATLTSTDPERPNVGTYRCVANVSGALCLVEAKLTFDISLTA